MEGKYGKEKKKRSPRPAFDQHYNLITCIPKRAVILECRGLIFTTAQGIQRGVSNVKVLFSVAP